MEVDALLVASTLAKLLLYAVSFAASGAALFVVLFRRELAAPDCRAIARFSWFVGTAVLVLSLLRLAILVMSLGDGFASLGDWFLWQVVMENGEGRSAVVRLLGLALLPAAWSGRNWLRAVGLSGAAAVSLSFALTGHSSALAGIVPKLLLVVHLAAIAFWLGALYPLRVVAGGTDLPRIAGVMKRFGDLAAFLVPVLILAGLALAWILVGWLGALFTTIYGRLLLLKLSAVAGLLALAAVNKLRLTPRLRAGDALAAVTLRASIAGEIAFVSAILLATAVFTTIVGPPALD
jgi:copper resistance protein D